MSTVIGEMRTNIIAALSGFDALAGKVRGATGSGDAWALFSQGSGQVFVSYLGFEVTGPDRINTPLQTIGFTRWEVACVAESYTAPTAAQTKAAGTDELADAVLAIRNERIGPARSPQIKLVFRGQEVVEHPERLERGGPVMVICRFESTGMYL